MMDIEKQKEKKGVNTSYYSCITHSILIDLKAGYNQLKESKGKITIEQHVFLVSIFCPSLDVGVFQSWNNSKVM